MAVDKKIKNRIGTLNSLNSIFAAMQIITMTKLSRAKERAKRSHEYAEGMKGIVGRMDLPAGRQGLEDWREKKNTQGKVIAIVISGSRGLCGPFNQNIFYRLASFAQEHSKEEVEYFVFGKKGETFLSQKGGKIRRSFLSDKIDYSEISALCKEIFNEIELGQVKEIYLIYNHSASILEQRTFANRLYPIDNSNRAMTDEMLINVPDRKTVNESVLIKMLEAHVFAAWNDSMAGELSARMVTLKSAQDNSKNLIDTLIITRNKLRQQAITQEILEIVEASEAMSGRE
ncbi:MAG: ATP synthase F1 subunit gamma [Candidatus Margulisiibacteriota bacterium]